MSKRKKNKKIDRALWIRLTSSILMMFGSTILLTTFITLILYNSRIIVPDKPIAPFPTLLIVASGLFVGGLLSIYIAHQVLRPIDELQKAIKKVASGDFTARLEEDVRNETIKDINKSFNSMAKQLSNTETLRSDFVANVSHEFKTPLAAIEGYTTLLQNPNLSEEKRSEYVEKVIVNTRRLSDLTGNILKLTKLDNQDSITDKTVYGLDEQIRQVIVDLEASWEKKGLELNIDLDDVDYFANEALLYQVWYNLISNAIKFSSAGGLVTVAMQKTESIIKVTVSDNGIGISEDAKSHIFEKFYQADKTHSEEGNGLGLPLVKKIVTLMNGKIYVESLIGIGSTFTVELPLEKA